MPIVCGNQGVAEVAAVGKDVKGLAVGDWVVPTAPKVGEYQKPLGAFVSALSVHLYSCPAQGSQSHFEVHLQVPGQAWPLPLQMHSPAWRSSP